MTEDPRLAPLDRLHGGLTTLLALLDGDPQGEGSGVQRAWAACHGAFEEFRRLDTELGGAAAGYPSPVRARLAEVARLEAVARGRAAACGEAVEADRRRLGRARAHLRALTGEARVGGSCNVAG